MYHPQDKNSAYHGHPQAYHPRTAGEHEEHVNRTTIVVDGGRRQHTVDERPTATAASAATTAGGAALKVFEIILAIIILCLICVRPYDENRGDNWYPWLQGEEWTIFACVWALFFCLHFLLQYLAGCHRTGFVYYCKCAYMAGVVYLLAAVFFIIAGGIEAWMTTVYGYQGLNTRYNMRASAAAFCFLEAILFLISLAMSRFKTI